jgi:hypothetical protein
MFSKLIRVLSARSESKRIDFSQAGRHRLAHHGNHNSETQGFIENYSASVSNAGTPLHGRSLCLADLVERTTKRFGVRFSFRFAKRSVQPQYRQPHFCEVLQASVRSARGQRRETNRRIPLAYPRTEAQPRYFCCRQDGFVSCQIARWTCCPVEHTSVRARFAKAGLLRGSEGFSRSVFVDRRLELKSTVARRKGENMRAAKAEEK